MTLLAAIHGILTNQTDPSWPDRLDAWMAHHAPEIKMLKKEYRAGPFPRLNCWLKDPLLARSLANEIELFLEQPSYSSFNIRASSLPQVWLCGRGLAVLLPTHAAQIAVGIQ